MQGQLRNEPLNFSIDTECAHCGAEIQIKIDNYLNYSVTEVDASPLIFVPSADFSTLEDPSIIDAF